MERVVCAPFSIGCQWIENSVSKTSATEDRKSYLMVLANTVMATVELTTRIFISVVKPSVMRDKSFFPMEHVKTVHPLPEASLKFFAELTHVPADRFSLKMGPAKSAQLTAVSQPTDALVRCHLVDSMHS